MVTVDSKQGIAIYSAKSMTNSKHIFPIMEESMHFLSREGITHFIIDLTNFNSLSTNELHVLMKLGGILPVNSVSIVGIESYYDRILKMSGLDKMFGVFSNTAEAVNAIVCEKDVDTLERKHNPNIRYFQNKKEVIRSAG